MGKGSGAPSVDFGSIPKPRGGPFASGGSSSPGGGGLENTIDRTVNFNNAQKLLNKIERGKFKKLDDNTRADLLAAVESGDGIADFDFRKLPKKLRQKLRSRGALNVTPQSNFVAEEQSQDIFDRLRDLEQQRIEDQVDFNENTLKPLVGQLAGVQSSSASSIQDLINQGFTELNPAIQSQISGAQDAFFNQSADRLTNQFDRSTARLNQTLANQGVPLGRSSDSFDFFSQSLLEPLGDDLSNLSQQTELLGRQFANEALGNQRAALGSLLSTGGANAFTQGLNVPQVGFDPTFINPTGQFDPGLLVQQNQFSNQLGLQFDQLRRQPHLMALQAQLAQPQQSSGIAGAIGSIAGAALPFAFLRGRGGV